MNIKAKILNYFPEELAKELDIFIAKDLDESYKKIFSRKIHKYINNITNKSEYIKYLIKEIIKRTKHYNNFDIIINYIANKIIQNDEIPFINNIEKYLNDFFDEYLIKTHLQIFDNKNLFYIIGLEQKYKNIIKEKIDEEITFFEEEDDDTEEYIEDKYKEIIKDIIDRVEQYGYEFEYINLMIGYIHDKLIENDEIPHIDEVEKYIKDFKEKYLDYEELTWNNVKEYFEEHVNINDLLIGTQTDFSIWIDLSECKLFYTLQPSNNWRWSGSVPFICIWSAKNSGDSNYNFIDTFDGYCYRIGETNIIEIDKEEIIRDMKELKFDTENVEKNFPKKVDLEKINLEQLIIEKFPEIEKFIMQDDYNYMIDETIDEVMDTLKEQIEEQIKEKIKDNDLYFGEYDIWYIDIKELPDKLRIYYYKD